ncbi:aminotransferase class V-fold PLP-dependent enzyme [Lentimicrobium sp.]|jgi:selenocysteine lyase/cysteine desulfurase|uniref:aminotransferase class V-fold PLP-dependent enzyme n=1 Tax=Lentimicrobium sp. TaxID=2034841 RepID=UPI0025FA6563|nr:aminotransferase class V-fold PLP-dependent enzyme [Lentimicrobium sp.]MCO5256511.1 aminotransferase class V-fold PLP-dependent enzyme [Lentimicrobium sp.]MCO5261854.1 aminotransferase class V-fold PLP-dependent enzyme [Lentimicrobium sp.]HOP14651.1 aminotransferase class V-fold PLP-dependent enzyme [Lentimicrobium sp.]HPF64458.1 aminotransferase class V-fold PLP-dependent enzyme [Lentimicrobium sp.]HPJ62056.1 aminotransferase class V-fold PLP-dependent enzyme [Lentimicrobium sp.]
MENYFETFRRNTIGHDAEYDTPFGRQKLIYADWIASGRLYKPIEERLSYEIGPFIGNTHTETSETGTSMTRAYHEAHKRIKKHVNAGPEDVIITAGFGMTGVIVKFQRMMGLKMCGQLTDSKCFKEKERPVVFVTHMEHHSNHTSWFETMSDVVVLAPDKDLLVDPDELRRQLENYKDRPLKIGAFTACSNVTGVGTPYHQLAKIMHENGGFCFIDFAASAPYADINMHPEDPLEKLDAVLFSPHKFLGGPGSSGVLIFDRSIYKSRTPDQPGGGTVDWTNPWGEYKYVDDIELREDGGTPGFMQAIRTALCIELKERMGTVNIAKREEELLERAFHGMDKIPGLHILANNQRKRLGVISFYFENIHYNLVVKLLSDRYGIQVRGGCACAGTYGHYLLDVSYEHSKRITELINHGDLSQKPGWVRLSLHPTMTNNELDHILNALEEISLHHQTWMKEYMYNKHTNEFRHIRDNCQITERVNGWFTL